MVGQISQRSSEGPKTRRGPHREEAEEGGMDGECRDRGRPRSVHRASLLISIFTSLG